MAAIICWPPFFAVSMVVATVALIYAMPFSTKEWRDAITTIVQRMHGAVVQLVGLPTETTIPAADKLTGQDGQVSSEGFAIHTDSKSGEDGTMAILVVLQNPGLASEIGTVLRRDGRVVKSCPSVTGPEFLKEFPRAELIITDIAPPVLRFLTVGEQRLLSSATSILLLASPGHCASFSTMLRFGQDRCVASDGGPHVVVNVRHAVKEIITMKKTHPASNSDEVMGRDGQHAKRVTADHGHEHGSDRFARKAINRQTRLVSDIAHDLRTPLTAIGEFAELMQSGLSGVMNDQQRRYVGIIERCCNEAARMVYDLLDGARLQSGHIHPYRQAIEVRSVFEDVIESLEPAIRQSDVELRMETPDSLPRVFADRDMLGRIVGNLVCNAIKFSPANSTVTLRSERLSVSLARISVIDMGSGISPSDLRRIFHRFEQGSNHGQHGIGLGLAIVRELVKLHGGRVTVESAPGKGSRFHFTIPLFLPTAILRRHLANKHQNGTATAWAFTLQDSAKYDAIHRLITASVRARDLVLPEDARRHLLLVTYAKQPERLVDRMRQQIATYAGFVPAIARLNLTDLPGWLTAIAHRTALSKVQPSAQLAG